MRGAESHEVCVQAPLPSGGLRVGGPEDAGEAVSQTPEGAT